MCAWCAQTKKDRSHFYSRVAYDGADGSGFAWAAAKAGAAYLLEGVVDAATLARGVGVEGLLDRAGLGWLTKGTCNAGDVQMTIRFEGTPELRSVHMANAGRVI